MIRQLLLMGMVLGLMACDRPDNDVTGPTLPTVIHDTGTVVVVRDTTPKDTVTVLLSKRLPVVDTMIFAFSSPGTTTRTKALVPKDSLQVFPLDTGVGKVWSLKIQGRKQGRLWWTMDSLRVVPDSSGRIVLDSLLRRLVVADTAEPVVPVVVDTNLYIDASSLAGNAFPEAGQERGVFFRYEEGKLSVLVVSDGDVPGTSLNRVFNAQLMMSIVSQGTLGAVLVDDAMIGNKADSDSLSRLRTTSAPGGGLSSAYANIFANYRMKTLSLQVSKCTLDVVISLRSGAIPVATPTWIMPSIPDSAAKDFVFLGADRRHPTKTHFRIVIP
jgi:hypothetical protein